MLTKDQALQLKEAGLTAYNHNLDTSREFYPQVITTRSYDDRLNTIQNVRDAGLSVCSGGILGLGEDHVDRVSLLHQLATMEYHPESVPINALVAIEGRACLCMCTFMYKRHYMCIYIFAYLCEIDTYFIDKMIHLMDMKVDYKNTHIACIYSYIQVPPLRMGRFRN
jgi:hypothetical protein